MKRSAIACSLLFICLAVTVSASAQHSCEFNIVGTWKAATSDQADHFLYRFGADGTVKVFSGSESGQNSDLREISSATYKIDDQDIPISISFTWAAGENVFSKSLSTMDITTFDDSSFTSVKPGSTPSRWLRVDPNKYFIVLAARLGAFYDKSGPAFPALIKIEGRNSQVDAVGVYSLNGKRAFGTLPPEAYREFMEEPRTDSDVMLRLEITAAQYERGLKILRTWERRVREGALLYAKKGSLDNILLVKQVVESLGQCDQKIKIYKLSYVYDEDWISNKYGAPFVPFHYFKEMRRLNEALHVRDDIFRAASPMVASSPGR